MAEDWKTIRDKMRDARRGPASSAPTGGPRAAPRPTEPVSDTGSRPTDDAETAARKKFEEEKLDYAERLKKQISDANEEYQKMRRDDPDFDHQKAFEKVSQRVNEWESANAEEAKKFDLEGAGERALEELIESYEPGHRVHDALGVYQDLQKGDRAFNQENFDVATKDLDERQKQILRDYLAGSVVPKTRGDVDETDSDKPAPATDADKAAAKANRLEIIRRAREFLRETYGRYERVPGIEGPEGHWWAGPGDTAIVVLNSGTIWKLKPGQSYDFGRETSNWKLWQGHAAGWKDITEDEARTSGRSDVEVVPIPADFTSKEPRKSDPRTTDDPGTRPEGEPIPVFSRQFLKNGDKFTHVKWDDEWEKIQDGDKIPAYDDKGVGGQILVKNEQKMLEFIPNVKDDKADDTPKPKPDDKPTDKPKPDDTPDDKKGGDKKYEETPPEAWESLAPKKSAYEEAWEKYGAEERKRNPVRETPPEAWEQYASVHNVRPASSAVEPDGVVTPRPRRNPWQWIKEELLGIPPPLPEGHKTHAEKVLDEMLYGEGHSKEARELAQAAVAQVRKVDREAVERGLGRRWGIFNSKLAKAITRHTAIGLTVVGGMAALGLATVTAPVVLGVLGGAIAGQTTKSFLESRGEKGWKTALATWIVGSGTGILTGAIASNVDWGSLFGSGSPTGGAIPPGPSDTPGPLSPEAAGNSPNYAGPVPKGFFGAEFDALGGQLEITSGPESVWDSITSGLVDHNLLDHQGRQSFAQAFHRTVDSGFRDLFLSLDGESVGNTPWNKLQEGTVADFEKVFSNRNFVEKFCTVIEKNYPSLADKIDASGLTVKQFIRGYAYLHGVRIP